MVFSKKKLHNTINNKTLLKRSIFSFIYKFFTFCFIVGLSYLFLFPLFYMLSTALQSPSDVMNPSVIWIPKTLSLAGIKGAIKGLNFYRSISLTAVIAVFSTVGSLISCSLAGYAFARFDFALKKISFFFVILMILVPSQTLVMSNYLNFRFFDFGGILKIFGTHLNLLGTPFVFILPAFFAAGLRSGLFIFIFKQFFSGLPKELDEAAKIDGCSTFKIFYKIMVPLAKPAFVTVLLFSIIWHWNEYYNSTIYFVDSLRPISVMLNTLDTTLKLGGGIGENSSPYIIRMYIQAGALLSILPPLLLYIIAQRFFTESIERTGIVG